MEFIQVLTDWGPCPALPAPCESDYDRDGEIGIVDFLFALTKWGPCI